MFLREMIFIGKFVHQESCRYFDSTSLICWPDFYLSMRSIWWLGSQMCTQLTCCLKNISSLQARVIVWGRCHVIENFRVVWMEIYLYMLLQLYELMVLSSHYESGHDVIAPGNLIDASFVNIYVFQGIGPRVLWIGIGGSIFFGVLERTKRLLAQRRPTVGEDSKQD